MCGLKVVAILLVCLQLGNAYYLPGTYPKVSIKKLIHYRITEHIIKRKMAKTADLIAILLAGIQSWRSLVW